MKKADVLRELNVQAVSLGYPPVSEAKFEDWINEDLIEGAQAQGRKRGVNPDWDYEPEAIVRGLKILKLKVCGARRYTELRPCLWLGEDDTVPPFCIRDDLYTEFKRILKRQIFRNPWDFDARFGNSISEQKLARLRKRIKREVDPRFAEAGLVANDEIMLQLSSVFMFGCESKGKIADLMRAALTSLGLSVPSHLIDCMMETLTPLFEVSGILGHPKEAEKCGLDELRNVDQNDLVSGRSFYHSLLVGLEFMGTISAASGWEEYARAYRAAHVSVKDQSEWSLTFFAMSTIAAYRIRQHKNFEI